MTGPTPRSFELGGMRFVADIRPGDERGKSTEDEFILVKTPAFISFYKSLQQRGPKDILEIGMFEGGSLVLFDKLFAPERLVGVDIRGPIPALEKYRESREHVRAFYYLSQDDHDGLDPMLAEQFPEGIDLIVDDASHRYEQSRQTFLTCFPHLRPGGLYVLEDWSWSHMPPYQNPGQTWHNEPALTNLVLEFIVNLPLSKDFSSVSAYRDLVVVERASTASGSVDLDLGKQTLRGREFPLI